MIKQVHGWRTITDLENTIRSRTRDQKLFEGPLVFAYKNTNKTGTIKELIISKRLDSPGFMISELPFSGGWSGFSPNMPLEYLRSVVYEDLISNKTDKEIIKCFEELLNEYENKYKNEYPSS